MTCTPAPDESYVTAEIALLIEPFEIEGGCSTATIRKGQKFVWMHVYVAAYEEEGAWGAFEYQLSVKVNGTPVYTVNNLTFNTETECVVSSICDRVVEKVIDVSGFTVSASAQLEVIAHAVRPPGVDDPGHSGTVYTELTVRPRSRFLLSDTRQDFRPRNSDSADPVAASCNSDYDCYPSFEARLQESCCDVKIGFELSEVSTLAGVSTNYGSGTGADYAVDPELNQGMVSVSAPPGTTAYETAEPWTMANLMLSSKDYGGRAKVKAYFLAPETGQKIYAEVVEDLEQPPEPDSTMARQFARLPFDEDEDGMADGWESEIGGPNPAAGEDGEPGGGAPGDGLSAHDEFRGFHWLDVSAIKHIRTNAKAKKDIFYWDSSSDGRYGAALAPLTQNETLDMEFHPVNYSLAGHSMPSPTSALSKFTRNSTTGSDAYAVTYMNDTIAGGYLGHAAGFGKSDQPIRIDDSAIINYAQAWGNIMTASTLTAIVVAHETGHRFGLRHPLRRCVYRSDIPSQHGAFSIELGQYARNPSDTHELYTRYKIQFRTADQTWVSQDRASTWSGLLAGNSLSGDPSPIVGFPLAGSQVEDLAMSVRTGAAVQSAALELDIEVQELFLMDWIPRQVGSMASSSNWHFSQDQKNSMKVNVQ